MSTSTKTAPMTAEERKVIFVSSLGTVLSGTTFIFTVLWLPLLPSSSFQA